jgi:dTDP-4-dehydro-6-deoxy-alpha-D-glucopyranose 2,3-dehydratase
VEFLLQAKAEPGNIGWLQFCPSIQCTWSNLKLAHKGRHPPLAELLLAERGIRLIYQSLHNEEGGRFWRKTNDNRIILVADESLIRINDGLFRWVSLSQIKALALTDNLLNPFVKTVIAPL